MVGRKSDAKAEIHSANADACDTAVLDLAHLSKYTAGDEALMHELLALFSAQLTQQIVALGKTVELEDWLVATHTLKGAAGAVGAWQIAETAEALEQLEPASDSDQCRELIASLADQADNCLQVIEGLAQAA